MELVRADSNLGTNPNSPPSLKRVLAFTITAAESTAAVNCRAV